MTAVRAEGRTALYDGIAEGLRHLDLGHGETRALIRDTGGVAHFPRTAAHVAAVSAQVGRELREQYPLGFTPGASPGGRTFRKLDVTVTAPRQGRVHVRTRAGYETRP